MTKRRERDRSPGMGRASYKRQSSNRNEVLSGQNAEASGTPAKEISVLSGNLVGKMLNDRYQIKAKIGFGSFSEIHSAYDTVDKRMVAIKFETIADVTPGKSVLRSEHDVLAKLQGSHTGICALLSDVDEAMVDGNHRLFFVMELLGDAMSTVRKRVKKFSMPCAAALGLQMTRAIQAVHQKGFLQRDVKPSNFVMGTGDAQARLYIVDFGLAKKHMNHLTGIVADKRNRTEFRGTTNYASMAAHACEDMGRKDDLWSLFFVLCDMILGQLPWRNLKDDRVSVVEEKHRFFKKLEELNYIVAELRVQAHWSESFYDTIVTAHEFVRPWVPCNYAGPVSPTGYPMNACSPEQGSYMTAEDMLQHLPPQMAAFALHLMNLKFEDSPDYDYLASLLQHLRDEFGTVDLNRELYGSSFPDELAALKKVWGNYPDLPDNLRRLAGGGRRSDEVGRDGAVAAREARRHFGDFAVFNIMQWVGEERVDRNLKRWKDHYVPERSGTPQGAADFPIVSFLAASKSQPTEINFVNYDSAKEASGNREAKGICLMALMNQTQRCTNEKCILAHPKVRPPQVRDPNRILPSDLCMSWITSGACRGVCPLHHWSHEDMKRWLVYGQMPYRTQVQQLRHPPLEWPPDGPKRRLSPDAPGARAAHEFKQPTKPIQEHRKAIWDTVSLAYNLPEIPSSISASSEILNVFAGLPYATPLEMRAFAQRYSRKENPTAVPRVPAMQISAGWARGIEKPVDVEPPAKPKDPMRKSGKQKSQAKSDRSPRNRRGRDRKDAMDEDAEEEDDEAFDAEMENLLNEPPAALGLHAVDDPPQADSKSKTRLARRESRRHSDL